MNLEEVRKHMSQRDHWQLLSDDDKRLVYLALADDVPDLVAEVDRLNLQLKDEGIAYRSLAASYEEMRLQVEELQKINTSLLQDVSIKLGENVAQSDELQESNRLYRELLDVAYEATSDPYSEGKRSKLMALIQKGITDSTPEVKPLSEVFKELHGNAQCSQPQCSCHFPPGTDLTKPEKRNEEGLKIGESRNLPFPQPISDDVAKGLDKRCNHPPMELCKYCDLI